VLDYLKWVPDIIDPESVRPPKPAELVLLEELEGWDVLPCSGGYLQQPFTLMADLRAVRAARQENEKRLADKQAYAAQNKALAAQAFAQAGQTPPK